MKLSCLLFFSLFMYSAFAQSDRVVNTKDGVELVYEFKKIDSTSKKVKYSITATAINKNNYVLYYDLPAMTSSTGKLEAASSSVEFVSIKMDNSTGLFKDRVEIKGEPTSYKTQDVKILYKVEPNKSYTQSTTFNVKVGEKPIILVTFIENLRKLDEYKIEIFTKNFVDGLWKTDCGTNNILLTYSSENGKVTLLQTVNGKQTKWIQTSANLFVKEIDVNTTLIFNKQNSRFLYTSAEGVSMEWIKQQ